ncbi:PREDICTED: glutathione synthetase-like isoform X1 [Nicrophorus vespilloides]|uniref:Glutathione synthetase n=1 Tax=Nicrophorus vespilloides TaxID=110193 RepID=A0ABM1N1L5_NICVS|nr:PREDICTED: glutathione synthetase-like isoform X1 [Nicrophorus vespilloides]XP_017780715.1 PREDICTED: glutathione synthetase-like isoform X1 [Nicrophorus vespilloides]
MASVEMENQLPSAIPLPIPRDQLKDIVEKAKDWALMHGAAMRPKNNYNPDTLSFAPFILTPSAFPRKEFERAVQIQTTLNELMHKVAHNRQFLTHCLKDTVQADEFTGNLFKIYETVHDEGITQPISLGLLRSDLMLESRCTTPGKSCRRRSPYCCWKQVEFNCIASGFGWLGPASAIIQRYVLQELGYRDKLVNLPENGALQGLCGGMLEAYKIYGKEEAVIMFVVEDVTYNICDQRFHEFEIRRMNPDVRVVRKTLTQIAHEGKLGSENELLVDRDEVAVIYFRAGYEPAHYHSKKEWDARLLMERSQAIKCPSIQYHLAGTKKVQQELAKGGTVEMFLTEASKIESVKEVFTGLYSLDFDEFGDQGVQMALDSPERFVLKPQREGGGNNVYGQNVREAVYKMKDSKERTAWILMERINPPVSKSYMIRPGGPEVPELVDLVSELGIFGLIIGDSSKIFANTQVGHMLRTKISTADEGGVAAGLGALDSPYLID